MWGPLFSLQVELGQPCCCPSLMMDSAGSARYPSPAQPLLGSPLKCSSCQNLQIFFFENTGLDYFNVVLLFLLCIPGEGCTCSSWLPAEPCTGSWLWKEPLSPLGKSAVPGASPASRGLPVSCRARGSPGGSGAEALGVLLRVALGGREESGQDCAVCASRRERGQRELAGKGEQQRSSVFESRSQRNPCSRLR